MLTNKIFNASALQGADNLLDTELWEIPHSCGLKAQEKMLEFLDKNLK